MKVRFKNPPINEVVIAAYFNPTLHAFRTQHIGLLWSRLRSDFPSVEQRPPIGGKGQGQNSVLPTQDEFTDMPRYWFIAEDEIILIQVQKDAFLLNWRAKDSEYPHFEENLRVSFDKYYEVFESFLRDDVGMATPNIGRCELAYIDRIVPSRFWQGPEDTSKIVPSFLIPECDLPSEAVSAFNCTYVYNIDSNLQLQVAIRSATTNEEPSTPCLVLESRASGSLGGVGKVEADAWYDRAHKVIVNQFLSMTNEDVQQELWEREEVQ